MGLEAQQGVVFRSEASRLGIMKAFRRQTKVRCSFGPFPLWDHLRPVTSLWSHHPQLLLRESSSGTRRCYGGPLFQFLVLREWVQFCLFACFQGAGLVVWVPSSWSLMRWDEGNPPSPFRLSAAWLAVGYLEGLLFSCFHVCLFIMAWATAPQTASLINALSGWKWWWGGIHHLSFFTYKAKKAAVFLFFPYRFQWERVEKRNVTTGILYFSKKDKRASKQTYFPPFRSPDPQISQSQPGYQYQLNM